MRVWEQNAENLYNKPHFVYKSRGFWEQNTENEHRASAASAVPISASAASASAAFPPPSQSAASAKPEFTYKDRRAIICKKNSGWVYFRFDDGSEGHSYGKYLRIYSCTQMILCMVLKFIRGGEESHTIVNSFVYKLL